MSKRKNTSIVFFFLAFMGISYGQSENEIATKIEHLIAQMTLEEKVSFVHGSGTFTIPGVERLGIPQLVMSDGPHGIRPEISNTNWNVPVVGVDDFATYFPVGVNRTATWNKDLAAQFGKAVGLEARARGKDILLGPGINIIRSPLGGRNFEYCTEDPFLNSAMVVPIVKNIQAQDVAVCVKHYIANNTDFERFRINVEIDERTLREIYLPAYKAAVEEGDAYTFMGSYSKFRGTYASHNNYLVNQVLKGEYGFKGALISDWSAVHDMQEASRNGTDIEMGSFDPWFNPITADAEFNDRYYFLGNEYLEALKAGKEDVKHLNEKVRRILWVMFKVKLFDPENRTKGQLRTAAHTEIALKIAREGIVLLKNENNLLPINSNKTKSIAVIGENAIRAHANGGGSSQVKSQYEVTPLAGIKKVFGENTEVTYALGSISWNNHQDENRFIRRAQEVANKSDVAIIITGLEHKWGGDNEGTDRTSFGLHPSQDRLIEAVVEANPNTIVVNITGGAIDMSKWVDKVPTIIQMWYAGQEGGTALAEILSGQVNPSGKLPMSFPKKLNDLTVHQDEERYPGRDLTMTYSEGLFIGYRDLDSKNIEPQFAFGHGLSYTTFDYSDLKVTQKKDHVEVNLKVTNSGPVAGKEIVQLYVTDLESSVIRPVKELKAFEKINLDKGETQQLRFSIPKSSLSFYDEQNSNWKFEPGAFKFLLGASSKDIRLDTTLKLK